MNNLTILITYSKGQEIRFISHLDHIRALERAIRRADLPIAYSQGFNPRMKISYKSKALKVGETSNECQAELSFIKPIEPREVKERLNNTLPKGFSIIEAI
jgi:radical SAM-linked protein